MSSNKREVYLDYATTTPVDPAGFDKYKKSPFLSL